MSTQLSISGRFTKSDNIFSDLFDVYESDIVCDATHVFGFVEEPCALYGGRGYLEGATLSYDDIQRLNQAGISFGLTLTNHFFRDDLFASARNIICKIGRALGYIVVTNDLLAQAIRKDFPEIHIKASVIKKFRNLKDIQFALRVYDSVTLPMWMNDDESLLKSIPDKSRVTLFLNGACAYHCKEWTCYRAASAFHLGLQDSPRKCEGPSAYRMLNWGMERFKELGFSSFKMVPPL